jgi:hypothetical protein
MGEGTMPLHFVISISLSLHHPAVSAALLPGYFHEAPCPIIQPICGRARLGRWRIYVA